MDKNIDLPSWWPVAPALLFVFVALVTWRWRRFWPVTIALASLAISAVFGIAWWVTSERAFSIGIQWRAKLESGDEHYVNFWFFSCYGGCQVGYEDVTDNTLTAKAGGPRSTSHIAFHLGPVEPPESRDYPVRGGDKKAVARQYFGFQLFSRYREIQPNSITSRVIYCATIPHYFLIAFFLIFPLIRVATIPRRRRRRRIRNNQCPNCGYLLHGLTPESARCPECGLPIPAGILMSKADVQITHSGSAKPPEGNDPTVEAKLSETETQEKLK